MIELDEIKEKLAMLFNKYLKLNFKEMDPGLLDMNIFDSRFKLYPRDLLYMFFKIEEEFKIHICEEDIINKKFNTFNNIALVIFNTINSKQKNE